MFFLQLLTIAALGSPNTCQPRSAHPFMPIYHLVGNVTTDSQDNVVSVEAINDVSSVTYYKGLYHVFHQCCQNHWDHVVSKDLVHWTRLPPPLVPNMNPTSVPHPDWYDAHGSWDGSMSFPNEWNGITEPIAVYDIVEGPKPPSSPTSGSTEGRREYIPRHARTAYTSGPLKVGDPPTMAIARATNASDPFLLSWTKDTPNPIQFEGPGCSFPSEVWKTGDHWNFISYGTRYTTKDRSFHTWSAAPGPKFINAGENGGQFFGKIANLAGGAPPPPGAPTHQINVAGGNTWALGVYHPSNESWTTMVPEASIDSGPDANWMTGQFAGDRFMNIGWALGGPPMLKDDGNGNGNGNQWKAVADYPNEDGGGLRMTTTTTNVPVTRMMNHTDMSGDDYSVTHHLEDFGAVGCQKLCDGDKICKAWVWVIRGAPALSGDCCLKNALPCPSPVQTCTSGAKVAGNVPCGGPAPGPHGFTADHLTGLREVNYDTKTGSLVSNPVAELVGLRNGTLAKASAVTVSPGTPRVIAGTGAPADASTSDVLVSVNVPKEAATITVNVLANTSSSSGSGTAITGGVELNVTFNPAAVRNGAQTATATICTISPTHGGCGSRQFQIFQDEATVDIRLLVDRSIVEAFVMGGRVVFTKMFYPADGTVPDTHVALQAAGAAVTVGSVQVFSMGCGWSDPPYQPNPTMESISVY